jgi:hypothetical protein
LKWSEIQKEKLMNIPIGCWVTTTGENPNTEEVKRED